LGYLSSTYSSAKLSIRKFFPPLPVVPQEDPTSDHRLSFAASAFPFPLQVQSVANKKDMSKGRLASSSIYGIPIIFHQAQNKLVGKQYYTYWPSPGSSGNMINSSNAGKVAQSVSLLREAQLITKPSPREIEKYDQQRSDSLLPSSQQL
jgi:hypothetical protein